MVGMGLGLGLGLGSNQGGSVANNPICEAIAAKVCISATFKGHSYLIAPHVAYKGHKDAPFLDGVVVAKDGHDTNKDRLENFEITDLTDISKTSTSFAVKARFDPNDPTYLGKTICVVVIV